MRRREEDDRFAMPFAEIWQHSPFHPGARVSRFLEKFVEAGRFDADRFWEFVTAAGLNNPRPPVGYRPNGHARTETRKAES
jgi:hypothetical protein